MRLLVFTWLVFQITRAQVQPAASAEAHLRQAAADRDKDDAQHAVAELREALKLKPDLRDAHGMLGEILLAQGFAAEAVPHLEEAAHVYSQAVALVELNRLPEALRLLLALYGERADDPDLLFELGAASGALMQQCFDRLLRMYPESPGARELRARTGPGEPPAGPVDAGALENALLRYAQHSGDPEALFQLGAQSEKVMRQAFTMLLRWHPDSARAQQLQAQNYLGQGRGRLAEPFLRNALKLNPRLPGIHLALGRILLDDRGDLDGAEREFRAEARLRPGDAEAACRLGSVLLKTGRTREALVELQGSDQLKPDMLETLLELGKAYTMDNQVGQAEKVYRRMIEIDDTDELTAAAHLQLSQIYRRMGKPAEADQHLKRFRELNSPK